MKTSFSPWEGGAACLGGAILALPLGDTAWALSRLPLNFAWPDLSRSAFWAVAALAGFAWCLVMGLAWRFAFHLDWKRGLRLGALSLLPSVLGLGWKFFQAIPLPPPHDLPSRNLQILLAAQGIGTLWAALGLGIHALWQDGKLAAWAPKSAALRLGAVAFLFFQLNGLWVGQWTMTGDAPHYLLISHSLAYDGDLDLANNYRHRDWRRFFDYAWELPPQYPAQADGQVLTEHKPGLSILLAPAYRLAGDSGARWMLALMAAAAAGLFYRLCLELGFEAGLALLGWALFSFNALWMSQSQNVYAEMAGGLALLASLASLRGLLPASTGWAAIAFSYWLHIRYLAMGAALSFFTALKRGAQSARQALAGLALSVVSLVLAIEVTRLLFGGLNPTASRHMSLAELFNPAGILRYSAGIFLDQEYGFLPFAAVFGLAPLGLIVLWRRDRPWFWRTLLPAAAYFSLVGSFPYWWSNMAPNRFLTCLMPVIVLWTLEAWRAWGGRALFWALAAYSWAWGLLMSVLPWLNFSKADGQNWILKIAGSKLHLNLALCFPSFILDTRVSYVWLAAWPVATVLLWKRLGAPKQV